MLARHLRLIGVRGGALQQPQGPKADLPNGANEPVIATAIS